MTYLFKLVLVGDCGVGKHTFTVYGESLSVYFSCSLVQFDCR